MKSSPSSDLNQPQMRSSFSHYLPRLKREFYQADAVIFWTMPIENRKTGWLNEKFHAAFREIMLHTAAREGLFCPAYCLMPDHIHFVWMGLRKQTDQRNGVKFLREFLRKPLAPFDFQRQAHDHVLSDEERKTGSFKVACADYILLNPYKQGLVSEPREWPYLGTIIPGYPSIDPFNSLSWERFWKLYSMALEPGIKERHLPVRQME